MQTLTSRRQGYGRNRVFIVLAGERESSPGAAWADNRELRLRIGVKAGNLGLRTGLKAGNLGLRIGLETGNLGLRLSLEAGNLGLRLSLEAGKSRDPGRGSWADETKGWSQSRQDCRETGDRVSQRKKPGNNRKTGNA